MYRPVRGAGIFIATGNGVTLRKVLYIHHNHPANRAGGAETYLQELYDSASNAGLFEPYLVCRVGPPLSSDDPHPGARFSLAGRDPNSYYMYGHTDEFNRLFGSWQDKHVYTDDWRDFLTAIRPDLVHIQHLNWLGFDLIRELKHLLPDVPLVYTLHEFGPICYHNGQMVRTGSFDLCESASPRRCHECFPHIPASEFFLRERFIRSALELVDVFIAPSNALREKYVRWGISAGRIQTEEYGRIPVLRLPDPPDAGRRQRLAFLGQITEYKGVDVLLHAMKEVMKADPRVHLLLTGANLEIQTDAFQERIRDLLEETGQAVSFLGPCGREEVPSLMSAADWIIVPSLWWENSPLVIQESMMHRRPVICSSIGGMAEKVRHGVTGLHFRVGDPKSLADVIVRAVNSPELWDELRSQMADPYPMSDHLDWLNSLYMRMWEEKVPVGV